MLLAVAPVCQVLVHHLSFALPAPPDEEAGAGDDRAGLARQLHLGGARPRLAPFRVRGGQTDHGLYSCLVASLY